MGDTWDKIAVSKPVDRQTALSNAGGLGHQWSLKQGQRRRWDNKPAAVRDTLSGIDLRGYKFGRLTVVGLLDRTGAGFAAAGKNKKPAKWLVKCVCGRFEHRTAKAIRNPENHFDRCDHCRQTAYVRRQQWRAQTGRDDRQWWEF